MASIRLYDRTHECPTYAAIILFGKNPRYFMPGAYVQYVRFSGNEKGGDVLNEKRFIGPLYSMLPALESFMSDAIVTQRPVAVSLFREKTVINYPNNALRELMMNACMHRDYQSNMPIRLYQFDDHIEIMNAGGLYGEARPENFPLVNDYRNPIVAEAMKEMKYVNMFNQGVKRVQNMLRENGNKEAEFDVSKLTAFCVNVFSTEFNCNLEVISNCCLDDSQVDYLTKTSEKRLAKTSEKKLTEDDSNTLIFSVIKDSSEKKTSEKKPTKTSEKDLAETSEKTTKKVLSIIQKNPKITAEELSSIVGVTRRTIELSIRHLREKGLIKREGGRKNGYWKIIG